jgi:hypothetical protein
VYPAYHVARKRDQDKALLNARRNVYVRLPDGRLGLVCATDHILSLHVLRERPSDGASVHISVFRFEYPHVWDGWAWNLAELSKFVDVLVRNSARPKRGKMTRDKRSRAALYNKMRRQAGRFRRVREGTGDACLLLRCKAIKEIVPCLDGELVKFWLLAAAHANEVAVAWAEQQVYRNMGYHPTKIGSLFDAMVDVGLMRWIQRNYFNPVTRRKERNQYQFNPALVYVRRALRGEAYGLVDTPFAALPKMDEIPDQKLREKHDQYPVRESNQHQLTTTMNHHQRSTSHLEGGQPPRDYANQNPNRKGKKPDQESRGKSDQAQSAKNSTAQRTRVSAPARNPSPPSPSPRRDEFISPMPNPALESLAHRVRTEAPTRLWQARELVAVHGAAAVEWGLQELRAARRAGNVSNPFGLMRSWLTLRMNESLGEKQDAWYMPK